MKWVLVIWLASTGYGSGIRESMQIEFDSPERCVEASQDVLEQWHEWNWGKNNIRVFCLQTGD